MFLENMKNWCVFIVTLHENSNTVRWLRIYIYIYIFLITGVHVHLVKNFTGMKEFNTYSEQSFCFLHIFSDSQYSSLFGQAIL